MLEMLAELIRMFGELTGYVVLLGIGIFIGGIGTMAFKDFFNR